MAAIRALAEAEHHVAALERTTASQAEATLDALTGVLQRFGYLAGDTLTPNEKSAVLSRVYDPNGLLLVDLVWRGAFAHLAPAEFMELLSWYCYDREGPRWNRNQLSPRLWEVRAEVENATAAVQRAERRVGLAITTGFNPDFFGPVLSWCRGAPFAELREHVPISEGDLLLALNKTLDLATQVREALRAGAPNHLDARALAAKLEIGDRLLRRGIVAQSLRLATGVPPGAAESKDTDAAPAAR
jgi:superfamily II RNA helicase